MKTTWIASFAVATFFAGHPAVGADESVGEKIAALEQRVAALEKRLAEVKRTAAASESAAIEVPVAVMAKIREKAASDFPDDFPVQQHVIERQVKAWKALHVAKGE